MKIGDEVLIWSPTQQGYKKGVVKKIWESKDKGKVTKWISTYPCGIINKVDSFVDGVQLKWRFETQAEFYKGWTNPD